MDSRVHPTYKAKYGVTNWPEYERSLVRRGDVTHWLSAEAVAAWKPTGDPTIRRPLAFAPLMFHPALFGIADEDDRW